jgi:amidase
MMVTTKEAPNMSTYDAWQLNLEKDAVANAWIDAWRGTSQKTSTGLPIDGLLLPPSINCAHKHGEWPRCVLIQWWIRRAWC